MSQRYNLLFVNSYILFIGNFVKEAHDIEIYFVQEYFIYLINSFAAF